jgi:serine protease Do
MGSKHCILLALYAFTVCWGLGAQAKLEANAALVQELAMGKRQKAESKHVANVKVHKQASKNIPAVVEPAIPASLAISPEYWYAIQSKVSNTVVQIFSQVAVFDFIEPFKTPRQGMGLGSGFFIDDTGLIITNAHVVDQAFAISIQIPAFGKERFEVELLAISPERDLAALRLKSEERTRIEKELGTIPFLSLGDSDTVRRAQQVMALGYPLGQQSLKSTTGVVSGRERVMLPYGMQHLIQTSAPLNRGNSGGPSIDVHGLVIGVNNSIVDDAQNVGYIIPINEVKLFLKQMDLLIEERQAQACSNASQTSGEEYDWRKDTLLMRKPILGVVYNNGSAALTEYLGNPQPGGLYVVEAYPGSPLYHAGVQAGDMIYEIDGHRLDSFGEMVVPWSEDKLSLIDYVSRLMLGSQIKLVIYRKGQRVEIPVDFKETLQLGVRRWFPWYEKVPYEVLGGMVVMPLCLNHLPLLHEVAPELMKYADINNQLESVLVVTNILPDSAAQKSRALGIGATIKEVNGVKVTNMDEWRAAVRKSLDTGYLTIRTKEKVFCVLPFNDIMKKEYRLSRDYYYPISPFVEELVHDWQNRHTTSDEKKAA